MKYLALFTLFLFGCNSSPIKEESYEVNEIEESETEFERVEGVDYDGVEAAQNLDDFISDFEEAIMAHDAERCLSFFDEEYKQEQLNFLDGNLDQFLREFLCGADLLGVYTCLDLIEIDQIEFYQLELETGGTGFLVKYLITVGDEEFKGNTYIREIIEDEGIIYYGFVGAVG